MSVLDSSCGMDRINQGLTGKLTKWQTAKHWDPQSSKATAVNLVQCLNVCFSLPKERMEWNVRIHPFDPGLFCVVKSVSPLRYSPTGCHYPYKDFNGWFV